MVYIPCEGPLHGLVPPAPNWTPSFILGILKRRNNLQLDAKILMDHSSLFTIFHSYQSPLRAVQWFLCSKGKYRIFTIHPSTHRKPRQNFLNIVFYFFIRFVQNGILSFKIIPSKLLTSTGFSWKIFFYSIILLGEPPWKKSAKHVYCIIKVFVVLKSKFWFWNP